MKILYGISSVLFILLYYVVGYRRKIVRNNLQIAFPNKPIKERKNIEREFYKNFVDFMMEFIKTFSMNQADFKEHMQIKNLEVVEECKKEKKDIILLIGHMFNWEWLIGVSRELPQDEVYGIYKKVANNVFDYEVHKARSKFGSIPISVKEVIRTMVRLPNDGTHAFLFVADQSPYKNRIHYELNFFNRLTPVFNGYDKIARKKDYAVVYVDMIKKSRGKYEVELERIKPDEDKFKENEIVDKFYQQLTQNIKIHPALWLWSHKRWKYTSGTDYQL